MLMDIIANEGMDEEEDEIPDDETINMVCSKTCLSISKPTFQMLARSEDEFKKFERMDNERIMKNAGKPRLMEESELPEFLWFVQLYSLNFLIVCLANLNKTLKKLKEQQSKINFMEQEVVVEMRLNTT